MTHTSVKKRGERSDELLPKGGAASVGGITAACATAP